MADLRNVARATGLELDEVVHLLECGSCVLPSNRCDSNPALVRAALAAYRGRALPSEASAVSSREAARERELWEAEESVRGPADADVLAAVRREMQKQGSLRTDSRDPRKNGVLL